MNDAEAIDKINQILDNDHLSNFTRLLRIANVAGHNEAWRAEQQ